MTLEEAIEYSLNALQRDHSISLDIYRDGITVELYDPEGDLVWTSDIGDDVPEAIVKACATSYAI